MAMAGDRLPLVVKIAASYLRRHFLSVDQIGALILLLGDALGKASKIAGTAADEAALQPAVSIKRSVEREYIVCLDDGRHSRTLKRHLRTAHGMTPQQYRKKWRLPNDYPMTAPAYSEQRSQMAKVAGLGQKAGARQRAVDAR
jgi:predicted transcriptional regulator